MVNLLSNLDHHDHRWYRFSLSIHSHIGGVAFVLGALIHIMVILYGHDGCLASKIVSYCSYTSTNGAINVALMSAPDTAVTPPKALSPLTAHCLSLSQSHA